MIYMLAPSAYLSFGVLPSGQTYVSDQNQMIFIANNSTADQNALLAFGCVTLSPAAAGTPNRIAVDADARTTVLLPNGVYTNGSAGVGAKITASVNGALPAQDGITLILNQRLLACNQGNSAHNGLYLLTQVGDATHPYIFTRDTLFDSASEMPWALIRVATGTLYANAFYLLPVAPIIVGTTLLTFVRVS